MVEDENGRSIEITPLDFLEAVHCNPNLPLATRLRAAIEAAPYKHPKLSAAAIAHFEGKDFASQLDRAIERSKQPVPMLNDVPRHGQNTYLFGRMLAWVSTFVMT
jgi:hypothetical protein